MCMHIEFVCTRGCRRHIHGCKCTLEAARVPSWAMPQGCLLPYSAAQICPPELEGMSKIQYSIIGGIILDYVKWFMVLASNVGTFLALGLAQPCAATCDSTGQNSPPAATYCPQVEKCLTTPLHFRNQGHSRNRGFILSLDFYTAVSNPEGLLVC